MYKSPCYPPLVARYLIGIKPELEAGTRDRTSAGSICASNGTSLAAHFSANRRDGPDALCLPFCAPITLRSSVATASALAAPDLPHRTVARRRSAVARL